MPERGEAYFFCKDLENRHPHIWRWIRKEQEYLSLFDSAAGSKAIGDSTPYYLRSEVAAKEIHKFDPQAKIIVMLRRPEDMIISLHSMELRSGNESEPDLMTALDVEERRRKGLDIPEHCGVPCAICYREMAYYAPQVKRYIDIFPRENIHFIIFEDFVADMNLDTKRVFEFLGIKQDVEINYKIHNKDTGAISLASRRLHARYKSVSPILDLLPMQMRLVLRSLVNVATPSLKRPLVTDEVRNKIREEMKSSVEELESLLGRDLSQWR